MLRYEIEETLLVLPPSKSGDLFHWEVNMISWNDAKPKIDIRKWTEGRAKMGKGICLRPEEFYLIMNQLKEQNFFERK